jgi:lysozyme
VATLSFTQNTATGAFCKSTMARKMNAEDIAGACEELPK